MSGALEGLKILDFSTLLPGPYATMCLADMGADVLRIVSGTRPDIGDVLPPFLPKMNISAGSAFLARNKRSMTLNLKDHRALKIVGRLVSEFGYNIVVEQFRPGVMAKLKLDYMSLKVLDPSVIYCSITGYGQTGTMKSRAGHDINYLARSGIMSYSGTKEGGPSLVGMQIADVASGSNNAVIGILAAVIHRNASGNGQFIDISMTDGAIAFNAVFGAGFLIDGKNREREGTLLNGGSLYDYYRTKDSQYISFGGLEPQFFANFCRTINRADLIPGGVFPKNVSKVKREISDIIGTKTRDEWMTLFNETDACVEPVMNLAEVFNDPLAREREMVVELPEAGGGTVRQLANPIKFSETRNTYKSIGATVSSGTNTKDVFREMGYTDIEIEEFEYTGLFS
ncbi:MAG: CaiB/BaiF CoA transferase family protein [Syntrophales bacterium]|jgi:alpha-methylacyl-CoA racemase